jgi:hypothetical protein
VAIGYPCVYSVQTSSYTYALNFKLSPVALSADGNVLAQNPFLTDLSLTNLGQISYPIPLYNYPSYNPLSLNVLLRPRLNASGSLYFIPYPNYFEIVDVQHALLRLRFSLTQTIQNTATPLAVDSSGRYVYVLTEKSLTIVDLGSAPLSIGHLSETNAGPGSTITVRGSGFDSTTTATVGGVAASITFTDASTLSITIPAAKSGPQDIVLTKSDAESYTLENAITLP